MAFVSRQTAEVEMYDWSKSGGGVPGISAIPVQY